MLIGHVTRDILPGGGHTIGGTVSYGALTASALGQRVGILTRADQELDLSPLARGASLCCLPSMTTTTFRNVYVDGHREQFVYAKAPPLLPGDVPSPWASVPLVHIGPILGECDPALVAYFARRTFVGVTPQGWMRTVDSQGVVIPKSWAEAKQILPLVSAVVLSIEDIGMDWDVAHSYARQTSILVVTSGWDGGVLFVDGKANSFAAPQVEEADPTGAGDIFATAFFIAIRAGIRPVVAVQVATCLAARSVLRRGLASIPNSEDVRACPLPN